MADKIRYKITSKCEIAMLLLDEFPDLKLEDAANVAEGALLAAAFISASCCDQAFPMPRNPKDGNGVVCVSCGTIAERVETEDVSEPA